MIELIEDQDPVVTLTFNVHLQGGPITGWQLELDPSGENPQSEVAACLLDLLASLHTAKEQVECLTEELLHGN